MSSKLRLGSSVIDGLPLVFGAKVLAFGQRQSCDAFKVGRVPVAKV